jgi:Ner family transcriptional regulator
MFTSMTNLDSTTRKLLKDPKKRRAWVIYQVTLQGRSLATVARDAGVKRQTLYRVFDICYPRMEKLIADAVGLRPQEVFPERYDADGLPNRRMGRPIGGGKKSASKDTAKSVRRNVDGGTSDRHGEAA